jgi:hypothetical protein
MNKNQHPQRDVLEMAIEAVEWSPQPSPLDLDFRDVGESLCDLDLPVEQPCKRSGRGGGRPKLRL